MTPFEAAIQAIQAETASLQESRQEVAMMESAALEEVFQGLRDTVLEMARAGIVLSKQSDGAWYLNDPQKSGTVLLLKESGKIIPRRVGLELFLGGLSSVLSLILYIACFPFPDFFAPVWQGFLHFVGGLTFVILFLCGGAWATERFIEPKPWKPGLYGKELHEMIQMLEKHVLAGATQIHAERRLLQERQMRVDSALSGRTDLPSIASAEALPLPVTGR